MIRQILHKTKEKLKMHWVLSIILCSFLVMLLVHILFKQRTVWEFFIAEWSAGDFLVYCGSIIGASATIYVLKETLQVTEKHRDEDRAFSIRPYFLISSMAQPDNLVEIDYVTVKNMVGKNAWTGCITVLLALENVGAGNAVDVQISVSQKNNAVCSVPIQALVVGRRQYILIRGCLDEDLDIRIKYRDIANAARYILTTRICIASSNGIVKARVGNVTVYKT